MNNLEESIEGYIAFKQALGFDFAGEAQRLRAYLAFCNGEPLTEESALAWACSGAGHPRNYQIQRYESIRRFSEFAHALNPDVLKLKPGVLGAVGDRVVPYIFTDEDIIILMKVARTMKSPDGLRGEGLAFLIGLMRSCGLRISEALNLLDSNFDTESGTLDIVDSKFGTSRTIYLCPTLSTTSSTTSASGTVSWGHRLVGLSLPRRKATRHGFRRRYVQRGQMVATRSR